MRLFALSAWSELVRIFLPSTLRMAGAGIQFLCTIIVARLLGEHESAGFFFWSSVLMTSGPIATYGLEQIALRNVPRLHEAGSEKVGEFLASLRVVSLFVSFLIGFGMTVYAVFSEGPRGFQLWHLLPPLTISAIAVTLINGEALKGLARPVAGVVYGHLIPVSIFCVLSLLFANRLGSPGILTLYTLSYLTAPLLLRFGPVPDFRQKLFTLPRWESFKSVLKEGFSVFCVNLFSSFTFIVPLALVELTCPPAEVAHLTTAYRITILFYVLASSIHGVFAPEMSRAAEGPDPLRPVLRVYLKAIVFTLAPLSLPLVFGIAFPELVMSVFGEAFKSGATALRLLVIIQAIALSLGPVFQLLLMTGNTALMARLGILKIIVSIGLAFVLIPRFGGIGMILAMGGTGLLEEIYGLTVAFVRLKRKSRPAAEATA